MFCLKRQSHEIFDLWFFSSNVSHSFSKTAAKSPRYSSFKLPMMSLSHDSAVSMAPLSQISAVSLTPLRQNLAVPLTLLSQLKLTFIYDLAPWLYGVVDTAESKLSDVIDTAESKLNVVIDTAKSKRSYVSYTAESKLSGIIDTTESAQTPLSQFEKLVRLSDLLKGKWNKNSSKYELYCPRPLRQKLKKCGCIDFFDSAVSLTPLSQLRIWISRRIWS